MCSAFRHEQPRGSGAGGARLQDAVPPGLPHLSAWADAAVLEEGRRGAAHLRVPASLLGGLLHSHRASVPTRRQPLNPPPFLHPARGRGLGQDWPNQSCYKTLKPSQPLYSFLSSTRAFQFHHHPLNTTLSLWHLPRTPTLQCLNSNTMLIREDEVGWRMDGVRRGCDNAMKYLYSM